MRKVAKIATLQDQQQKYEHHNFLQKRNAAEPYIVKNFESSLLSSFFPSISISWLHLEWFILQKKN